MATQFPLPQPSSSSSTRCRRGAGAAEGSEMQRSRDRNSTSDLRPCASCSPPGMGKAVFAFSSGPPQAWGRSPLRSGPPRRARQGFVIPVPVRSGFLSGSQRPLVKSLASHDPAAEDTCLSPSAAAGFRTLGGHLEMVFSDENDLVQCTSKNILSSGLNWTVGHDKRPSCCDYGEKANELSEVFNLERLWVTFTQ